MVAGVGLLHLLLLLLPLVSASLPTLLGVLLALWFLACLVVVVVVGCLPFLCWRLPASCALLAVTVTVAFAWLLRCTVGLANGVTVVIVVVFPIAPCQLLLLLCVLKLSFVIEQLASQLLLLLKRFVVLPSLALHSHRPWVQLPLLLRRKASGEVGSLRGTVGSGASCRGHYSVVSRRRCTTALYIRWNWNH